MIAAGKKNCGRGVEPRPHDSVSASPHELRTELPDARITGVGDVSEASAADIPARIRKLRVVENIEELTADLERHGFPDGNDLGDSQIGVVEARAMEESAVRCSETSAIRPDQSPRH